MQMFITFQKKSNWRSDIYIVAKSTLSLIHNLTYLISTFMSYNVFYFNCFTLGQLVVSELTSCNSCSSQQCIVNAWHIFPCTTFRFLVTFFNEAQDESSYNVDITSLTEYLRLCCRIFIIITLYKDRRRLSTIITLPWISYNYNISNYITAI